MKAAYLKKIDKAIKNAGTRDAEQVLESVGLVTIDPGETIDGFITYRKGIAFYGVNRSFRGKKRTFGIYHEGGHHWCQHRELPNFIDKDGCHKDKCGSIGIEHDVIVFTEKDANIIGAHGTIETTSFLDMLGYDNKDVIAYRNSLDAYEEAVKKYRYHLSLAQTNGSSEARIKKMMAFRDELEKMYDRLQEQAQDIYNSGCVLTKYEIAREFGVPEYIIDLKIEALSYLHYDVASITLPSFDKVFRDWN